MTGKNTYPTQDKKSVFLGMSRLPVMMNCSTAPQWPEERFRGSGTRRREEVKDSGSLFIAQRQSSLAGPGRRGQGELPVPWHR